MTLKTEKSASASAASATRKIKSIVLTSTGSGSDYSNLQVKEEDYPTITKDDQVIVKIKAVGLNFAELMQRQGLYKPSTKTPYTPGYEGSGVVEQVAENVQDLKVNDRVIVFNSNGIWKEFALVPRSNVFKIPDSMSFEDAAGLLVNYMTAYHVLFRMAHLKPGDSVLIQMAAGGVGTAATQLCKTVPNVTVFGTASAAKHDAIRENGVDHPIDYTSTDYVEAIRKISPEGVDVCLDPLNGENSIKGYDLLKPFGKIVHYGAASMTSETKSLMNTFKTWWKCLSINSLEIISENKSISGYHLGVLLTNPTFIKTANQDIQKLLDLYEQGKIRIKIDSTYAYSKIGEAMKRMHSRLNVGKIILKPDSELTPPSNPEVQTEASTEQVKLISTEPLSVEKQETCKASDNTETTTSTATTVETTKQAPTTVDAPEPVSA